MSIGSTESSHPFLSHADGIAASTAWIGAAVEFVIGAALVLGVGTRYAALLCALFLIAATALAHRYWEYPAAQMGNQYNHFLKNLAVFGGALILFVAGPGRFSVDRMLSKRG
jgi:putative oxidoreductase